MRRSPKRGNNTRTTKTRKDKTMIATTNKNGKSVRVNTDFQFDTGKAYFRVCCEGVIFEFEEFAPASRVYNTLSKRIEGGTYTDECLKNLVSAARTLGYKVTELR